MSSASMSILRRVVSQSCRKFCSGASSELAGRPSLILKPSLAQGKVEYKFYSPLKKGIVCFNNRSGGEGELDLMKDKRNNWVASSHGWVVMFEYGGSYNMCLLNPLSGRRIQLPPYRGEPFLDKDTKERNWPFKVILSHSPDKEECRAVMILGSRDRAAFCSPGRSQSWSPLGLWYDSPRRRMNSDHDFVYSASRKTFVSSSFRSWMWGMSIWDDLEFWDVASLSTTTTPVKTVRAPRHSFRTDPGYQWATYLVSEEESGQLFMVRRYFIDDYKGIDYKVYRITATATSDNDDVQLQPCESLDGLVMFIGVNHCFAVKASRYPEFKPNAIYFCGDYWPIENQRADTFYYDHTKAYSAGFDFSPDQNFHFRSNRPPMFTFNSE